MRAASSSVRRATRASPSAYATISSKKRGRRCKASRSDATSGFAVPTPPSPVAVDRRGGDGDGCWDGCGSSGCGSSGCDVEVDDEMGGPRRIGRMSDGRATAGDSDREVNDSEEGDRGVAAAASDGAELADAGATRAARLFPPLPRRRSRLRRRAASEAALRAVRRSIRSAASPKSCRTALGASGRSARISTRELNGGSTDPTDAASNANTSRGTSITRRSASWKTRDRRFATRTRTTRTWSRGSSAYLSTENGCTNCVTPSIDWPRASSSRQKVAMR